MAVEYSNSLLLFSRAIVVAVVDRVGSWCFLLSLFSMLLLIDLVGSCRIFVAVAKLPKIGITH